MSCQRRMLGGFLSAIVLVAAASALSAQSGPVAGRNVNIVGGPATLTLSPFDLVGDPFAAQQNEASCAYSPRFGLHILCGMNDYRAIDLPGIDTEKIPGDAWAGVAQSRDGGLTWESRLHPGFMLDSSDSVLKPFPAIADSVVRIGPGGLGFYSGIAFERTANGLGLLFVSTWMDLLAREGDPTPFKHVRTVMVDGGHAGRFIDKPWMALGTPIPGQTCTLNVPAGDGTTVSQTVPRTPVYLAWAVFPASSDETSAKIYFSRSVNCGVSFSPPIDLSAGNILNQGVQVTVVPFTDDVYVSWRRGATATQGDALMVRRSGNGGQSFSPVVAVAAREPLAGATSASFPYCPFDQGTSAFTFRTTGFPTMASGAGRAFMFWSQRQGNCSFGTARVVMSSTTNGVNWTPPVMVDDAVMPAHQIMPTATVAGSTLQVGWFDFRNDASGVFGPFVEELTIVDPNATLPQGAADPKRRHTVDVRGAQAQLGLIAPATLSFTPYPVSQYIFGIPAGQTEKQQLQYNPVNVRMFKKMTVPFISDYLDFAAPQYAPAHPVYLPGIWAPNAGQLGDTPSMVAWTDQRNVKLFPNEDYSKPRPYTRKNLPGLEDGKSLVDPFTLVDPCTPSNELYTGTKNQDVFVAPVLARGWFAAAAWNNKPLGFGPALPDGTRPLLQRAFAVFARNITAEPKQFRVRVANQPPGGRASLDQFTLQTEVEISVPARSMVARTVYVEAPAKRAAVAVDVTEIPGPGFMRVWLNPDPSAPETLLLPESVLPNEPALDITNFEVYDVTIGQPTVKQGTLTPGLTSTGWPAPEWENPEWENPEWENPEWENPEWENPEWENPEWENPEWENPEWENPEWENGALTDEDYATKSVKQFRWRVENVGNTTAAYSSKVAVLGATGDFKFQLVVYKLYTTPATTTCLPNRLVGHTHVLSNVINLDVSAANFESSDWENTSAARYTLEPGEVAYVALQAVGTTQALADLTTEDTILGTQPQAVNTIDKLAGVTEPEVTLSTIGIVPPASLPEGTPGEPYPATTFSAFGGAPPYTWSWFASGPSETLPPGLTLNPTTGVLSGTPTGGGTFTFTVQATDSSTPALVARRTLTLTITRTAPNLNFEAQPSDAIGGQPMSPDVIVSAMDDSGSTVAGLAITLSLGNNPGNGTLTGATATTNADGRAVFSNLVIDRGGRGYTLVATAPGALPATSTPFNVVGFSGFAAADVLVPGRVFHTATRLLDGRVLIAGGQGPGGQQLSSAMIYDPSTRKFTPTGNLYVARQEHTATLLENGHVLIVGGLNLGSRLASAEIFDPSAGEPGALGTFSYTASLTTGRSLHTATRLLDGTVLIAGGVGPSGADTATAERYYPLENVFLPVGSLASARHEHRATALPNGEVAITGGFNGASLSSVEIFDPNDGRSDGGAFQPGGTLRFGRHNHEAVLLPTGKILVAGGISLPRMLESFTATQDTAELYDPATALSVATPNMTSKRQGFTATVLNNGTVLLAGGNIYTTFPETFNTTLDSAEVYDPTTNSFAATGRLITRRQQFAATLLDDGEVLVTGGSNASSNWLEIPELYHPLPAGVVTDPNEAAVGTSDLVSAHAFIEGVNLRLRVRFAPDSFVAAKTTVQFILDTDQNAATGQQGSDSGCSNDAGIIGGEYIVDFGAGFADGALIRRYQGTCNSFGDAQSGGPVTFIPDGMEITIPLSRFGDDGKLNFKVISFEYIGPGFTGVLDYMPDVGSAPGKLQ